MNGYVCFYNGKRWECHAPTTYDAQKLAAAHWKVKPKLQYKIAVVLAEKDGQQVTHKPGELP